MLRNIDVGSCYGGVREFYFSLLCLNQKKSSKGIAAVQQYSDRQSLVERLPHRKDGLQSVKRIGVMFWSDIAAVLKTLPPKLSRGDEAVFAQRALEWLMAKGVDG